jgi:hypothetical protein
MHSPAANAPGARGELTGAAGPRAQVNRNPDLEPHTRRLDALLAGLVEDSLSAAIEVHLRLAAGEALPWPLRAPTRYVRLAV